MVLFCLRRIARWQLQNGLAGPRGSLRPAMMDLLMKVTDAVCYLEFSDSYEIVVSKHSNIRRNSILRIPWNLTLAAASLRLPTCSAYISCRP